jgi:hypothetical protein
MGVDSFIASKDGPMATELQSCSLYIPVFRLAEHSACHLLACWFAEPISSILKTEAIYSSETSVETQRTTRRHIPEDDTLQLINNFNFVVLRIYKKAISATEVILCRVI